MTNWALKKNPSFAGVRGPVVVCVMDGIGNGKQDEANAVWLARKPNLDFLAANSAATELLAHGTAVGMPSDADMGNSEVEAPSGLPASPDGDAGAGFVIAPGQAATAALTITNAGVIDGCTIAQTTHLVVAPSPIADDSTTSLSAVFRPSQ